MNVLLVNIPATSPFQNIMKLPPLGLMYLASSLRSNGINCRIIDCDAEYFGWSKVKKILAEQMPDVLGFSLFGNMLDNAKVFAKIARPYCKYMIAGGPAVPLYLNEIKKNIKEIDFLFSGEAENSLVDFISNIKNNKKISYLINSVKIKDLNNLTEPDYTKLPIFSYCHPLISKFPLATVITSRGCSFKCTFCDRQVSGTKIRYRKVENIVDQLEMLTNEIGFKSIIFYDDNFTNDKQRIINICDEILSRNINIVWRCESRPINLTKDVLNIMKKAGCESIAFGVESFNDLSLTKLNKAFKINDVIKVFKDTRDSGIRPDPYFMVALPWHDEYSLKHTLNFAKSIGSGYAQFSTLSPIRGTKLWEEYKDQIITSNDPDNPLGIGSRDLISSNFWTIKKQTKAVSSAYSTYYTNFMDPLRIKDLFHINKINIPKAIMGLTKWYLINSFNNSVKPKINILNKNNSKFNIVSVVPYYSPAWSYGGIVRLSYNLNMELAKKGHKVSVITTDTLNRKDRIRITKEKLNNNHIVYRFKNINNYLAYWHQLFLPIDIKPTLSNKIQKADIIHIHGFRNLLQVYAVDQAFKYNKPVIIQPNGTLPAFERKIQLKNLWDLIFSRNINNTVDKWIAVSGSEIADMLDFNINANKIKKIPNGIEDEFFKNNSITDVLFRNKFNIRHKNIILFMGKITRRKGIKTLLYAIKQGILENTILVIAGNIIDGRENINKIINKLKIRDKVIVTGLLSGDERISAYKAASVFVYPSEKEIFGLAPLEAAYMGCPVIACDDSGTAELIDELEMGIKIPAGNFGVLNKCINNVLLNKYSFDTQKIQNHIRKTYSWQNIANKFEELYYNF